MHGKVRKSRSDWLMFQMRRFDWPTVPATEHLRDQKIKDSILHIKFLTKIKVECTEFI